jgi:hypothetical protein
VRTRRAEFLTTREGGDVRALPGAEFRNDASRGGFMNRRRKFVRPAFAGLLLLAGVLFLAEP